MKKNFVFIGKVWVAVVAAFTMGHYLGVKVKYGFTGNSKDDRLEIGADWNTPPIWGSKGRSPINPFEPMPYRLDHEAWERYSNY